MRLAKIVFAVAGIYGLLLIPPMYFLEERIGREEPPAITHPEFFYGFVGVTLAWQIAFLVIARDPARFRPMMLPAILEKVGFAVAAPLLYDAGRVSPPILVFGGVDGLLGLLFMIAFWRTAKAEKVGADGR